MRAADWPAWRDAAAATAAAIFTLDDVNPLPCRLRAYPESLAVGPDVGRRPVGEALDVQRLPLSEAALLGRLGPGVEQTVHLQQLAGR